MLKKNPILSHDVLLNAFTLLCTAKAMTDLFEKKSNITAKYVHATSRGHEAIQLAVGLQLKPQDWLSAYYRDDSILLGMGITPYELILQLLAKREDPFSAGRTYYSHPSLAREGMPKIAHQSSATGMQAIPSTGIAMGIQYREKVKLPALTHEGAIVVCSLGDGSITEGEVSEAFQMAVLKKLPILYLVQDNGWDISASADEVRSQDAAFFAKGFNGLETRTIDGADFFESYETIREVMAIMRTERRPFLVHAKVPLLNHHTSGVRKEKYREDLEEHAKNDPFPRLRNKLIVLGIDKDQLNAIEEGAVKTVQADFERAQQAEDPRPEDLLTHVFAPSPITHEKGIRAPLGREKTVMVDSALFAIRELMDKHKECLLYGQDVGKRLGGVFREAATLADRFGADRVFNTPIQEAFIIGSTVGMSAVGLKPIVEVQFADYIWPGLNQLFTEVSRSCYLTNGKYPVSMVLRVPVGAYGSGGPYHSSSIESVLTNIRGIKIAYPSTGADLKGLMKSAYYDPNPVVILEHKGLYWSKIKGTEEARTLEPNEDYVIPFGKARMVTEVTPSAIEKNNPACTIIAYGMGVYWASNALKKLQEAGKDISTLEIIDLRTLVPLDEITLVASVKKTGRCLIVSEEIPQNSFAQALAGSLSEKCFEYLDAPVRTIGSENVPAVPLNSILEETMLPNAHKVAKAIEDLLSY
jgi:2-oxoisovalerate dehydrogenase E1 component